MKIKHPMICNCMSRVYASLILFQLSQSFSPQLKLLWTFKYSILPLISCNGVLKIYIIVTSESTDRYFVTKYKPNTSDHFTTFEYLVHLSHLVI